MVAWQYHINGFINVYNMYQHENPMIAHHIEKKWWSFIPSITWFLNVIESRGTSDASGFLAALV